MYAVNNKRTIEGKIVPILVQLNFIQNFKFSMKFCNYFSFVCKRNVCCLVPYSMDSLECKIKTQTIFKTKIFKNLFFYLQKKIERKY